MIYTTKKDGIEIGEKTFDMSTNRLNYHFSFMSLESTVVECTGSKYSMAQGSLEEGYVETHSLTSDA